MTDVNMTALAESMRKATEDVKALGEELRGKMSAGEQKLDNLKGEADEALIKMNEIKAQQQELEQHFARMGSQTQGNHAKSYGQQLVESEGFKHFSPSSAGSKATLNINAALTDATTDADGSAGALTDKQRVPGIVAQPERRLFIRDLIMPGNTDQSMIEYIKETGFTNNAASQAAQGDAKAESSLKFSEATSPVRTIAHFIKASKQILNDAPMLRSYIDGRLMYGLKLKEEAQLLNGDGTGGNLTGINTQATAFADPAALASYTIIDQLRLAMLQSVLAEYPATGHVLNPIDWAKIELEKDANGLHIIGRPAGDGIATLWRLPVVETQSQASGTFTTGAFNMAAQIFDREQSTIEVGYVNDDFTKNLVTVLCEERLALAVYRPEALIKGTLAAKIAP